MVAVMKSKNGARPHDLVHVKEFMQAGQRTKRRVNPQHDFNRIVDNISLTIKFIRIWVEEQEAVPEWDAVLVEAVVLLVLLSEVFPSKK